MVGKTLLCAAILMLPAAASAESPQDRMFPRDNSCYARSYGPLHLAQHPAQRVTRFAVSPDFVSEAPRLALELRLSLRGDGGGAAAAFAVCEQSGAKTLLCGLEGDGGGFEITPARRGAILVTVGRDGMTLETATGFVTLERDRGDDRSFILRPVDCG